MRKEIILSEISNIRSIFFRSQEKFDNEDIKSFWVSVENIEKEVKGGKNEVS